jgi:protein-tyrosine phosphatase
MQQCCRIWLGGMCLLSPAPRPRKASVLVEFSTQQVPSMMSHRIVELGRAGLRLVIAHPERYRPVWEDDSCLDPLLDQGVYLLLDVCALVGKYGAASQSAAEKLLDGGAYEAACSDAHRPGDVAEVERALQVLRQRVGNDEANRLFTAGPRRIVGMAA